ncbi:hypothetical protein DKP84_15445 [Acinetobacter pittii]|nr:hypothetical protein DKP84_15445 [Acinetobacter pittii]
MVDDFKSAQKIKVLLWHGGLGDHFIASFSKDLFLPFVLEVSMLIKNLVYSFYIERMLKKINQLI